MNSPAPTLNEIRLRGMAALLKELGPVDFVRFMQQFDNGKGDYTSERGQWLDAIDIEQIKGMAADAQKK